MKHCIEYSELSNIGQQEKYQQYKN